MPPPQRGPGIAHFVWQRLEPVQYGSDPTAEMEGDSFSIDQSLGALDVTGCSRMLERFHLQSILFVPLAGTDVQFVEAAFCLPAPCGRGDALSEALPQQVGKEVMITVPASLVVEGDQEQVCALKIFQHKG